MPTLARRWWRSWTAPVLALLYPPACAACGAEFEEAPPDPLLCLLCRESLRLGYDNPCPRCAMPLAGAPGQAMACRECGRHQHRFSAAVAVGRYDGLLRDLVLRAKSQTNEALALALGSMLAERLLERFAGELPDGIVAVPAPTMRRLSRAINAADVLAEAIAQRLRSPRLTGTLRFVRPVRKQTHLTVAQRRRNLRHALAATSTYDLRGAHLLVVDDVLTTGATADETSRALLVAGAAHVSVAAVARGIGYD